MNVIYLRRLMTILLTIAAGWVAYSIGIGGHFNVRDIGFTAAFSLFALFAAGGLTYLLLRLVKAEKSASEYIASGVGLAFACLVTWTLGVAMIA